MRWIVYVIIVTFISCNTKHVTTIKSNKMIEKLETEGYQLTANKKGDFLIGLKQIAATSKVPFKQTFVKIYSAVNNRVIFSDELRDGVVKWIDNDNVKVTFALQVQSTNTDDNITEYIYNVRTQQQTNNKINQTNYNK